ncbi:SDR family NAD(P)-dependent oxidoreductase [Ramlibacter solisilvae]|uniref:3-oxoacyl-ACP reductase n=1 Tax=Ramlibacter tataouinensis TaxID=94132 RepID=A0A127JZ85_9BURK|nr:SDR family NAD(P)-dependent oxidoreductase [Ramlibacter tataouinensis]AMO25270.1 3-oxoacyl-ACP reductase [Ramlibacter tataouinensis]
MPNTYDLEGKSAIVTGAAKGIGRAIAELLLANGCQVTIWDANPAHLPGARSEVVDITQPGQVATAVAAWPDDRRIDVLVNDAGYLGRTSTFAAHPPADWRRIVEVNLLGTMQVTQAVVPIMVRQGGGRIINLGSLAGKEGLAGIVAYSAASAGIISFTKALGRELAQHHVFVNCVAPGPIDTDMIRDLGPEVVGQMVRDSPMGRLGDASEVAHLVAWLCTEASRFNTGAVFDMSGGRARY